MSSDTCCWPKCRQPSAVTYSFGTKTWRLCDYHGDLVQDEDDKVAKRARKKAGMPQPERYPGRVISMKESARCVVPGCGYPASLVRYRQDGLHSPLCNEHKDREDFVWDGVWHEFIPGCGVAPRPLEGHSHVEPVERPHAPPEAPEEEDVVDDDDADFSEFESRLASGNYDWEDD